LHNAISRTSLRATHMVFANDQLPVGTMLMATVVEAGGSKSNNLHWC